MTTKIRHITTWLYLLPVEVISQHNWNNIGQISFYGWIGDEGKTAKEIALETESDSLVAIFKIKYKS